MLYRMLGHAMGRGRVVWPILAALAVGCGAASSLPDGEGGGGGQGGAAGGNPLVGTWVATTSSGGTTAVATLSLDADGMAVETVAVTASANGACTGTLQYTGVSWSATTTTIDLTSTGVVMCTGGLTCPGGTTVACASEQTLGTSCTYALTEGDSTLVLTCNGPSLTFTRQG